jgi:hypothetical protein
MDYPGKVITKTQVTPTQTSASGNWTLDDQAAAIKNNNWPVALVPNPISKSLRFNSADTAYLNRTPATATNRRTWTWSGWVKKSVIAGDYPPLFNAGQSAPDTVLRFSDTDTITAILENGGGGNSGLYTTQVFRDPSAWYHIVWAVDTTQATANNRQRLYVNGVEVTAFSTRTNPTQNFDTNVNNTVQHRIGGQRYASYFNGYMTEINFIDGQQLTPSDFGLTNPQTGQWIPKKYTGTYGTNGFYLNFKDATSTTTLGYDYSGNANNWTTNNFSVTAGSGNDSLTDVPTPWVAYNTTGDVGGVVRGNYATLNPISTSSYTTVSDGNLKTTGNSATDNGNTRSTFAVTTGKWYAEFTVLAVNSVYPVLGIQPTSNSIVNGGGSQVGSVATGCGYFTNGNKYVSATSSAYGSSFTTSDVIGIAVDCDNGAVYFAKNGTWQNSGVPTSGASKTGAANTWTGGAVEQYIGIADYNGSSVAINFGQRPFAYTPPAGFRSLCTTNLPATAIGFGLTNQASNYFNAVLRNGYGSSGGTLDCGFQPDFVWEKVRNSGAAFHNLLDSNRGLPKNLWSNDSGAETNATWFTGFVSNGITFGTNDYGSSSSLVDWVWKANQGVNVTNTAGTITSTVSANTTSGFSIVTYTGNGSAGATFGHGLGVAPSMIIVKNRGAVTDWLIYHISLGATKSIAFDTAAAITSSTRWNDTAPSSTLITLGTSSGVNGSTNTYVAYAFAPVAGYSAFGSYTGNGSTDGPFAYLGFRPRYVMIKRTDSTSEWYLLDSSRDTYNPVDEFLWANLSNAEATSSHKIDFVSNGFKQRYNAADLNASGGTYIYMAFAEFPFQFSNAR